MQLIAFFAAVLASDCFSLHYSTTTTKNIFLALSRFKAYFNRKRKKKAI
jgi:hypothetical protein